MKLKRYISLQKISISIFIMTVCLSWLFEDILGLHVIVVLLLGASFGYFVWQKKVSYVKGAGVLLLYGLGILISIIINGASIRVMYRVVIILMMLLYANTAKMNTNTLNCAKRCIIYIGLFAAAMVLVQFLLRDVFTNVYYNLMQTSSRAEALSYYNRGYFSGLYAKPHEAAGVISMTIAAMLINGWNSNKKIQIIFPLVLFIPLLLTGKRAITILVVVSLFVLQILAQLANRKWLKAMGIVTGSIILVYIAIMVISLNSNNALFARFALLLNQDSGTSFIDGTRLRLWEDAWNLWLENPFFGVGWSKFEELSVSQFSYLKSHSVNLDYLQMLCEMGIVGFIPMITSIIVMFWRAIKLVRYSIKAALTPEQKQLILFAVYIQIFILLYAFVEVPFYSILFFSIYVYSCMIINTYYIDYLHAIKRSKLKRYNQYKGNNALGGKI